MTTTRLWSPLRPGAAIAGAGFIALCSAWGLFLPRPTAAIEYMDGTVGFSYPLRLSNSYATRSQASDGNATYYLTIDFPAAAAEPLDRIVVSLDEGYDPMFRYRLDATEAFVDTPDGRVSLPLGELAQAPDQALSVTFDPPVQPGAPVTLALRPVRNPRFGGVYLFGATAYPVGQAVESTFTGYARLSFYERDGDRWP